MFTGFDPDAWTDWFLESHRQYEEFFAAWRAGEQWAIDHAVWSGIHDNLMADNWEAGLALVNRGRLSLVGTTIPIPVAAPVALGYLDQSDMPAILNRLLPNMDTRIQILPRPVGDA